MATTLLKDTTYSGFGYEQLGCSPGVGDEQW